MTEPSTTKRERDALLDHDYDGIKEYDNPLPGWWVWLFWATIVFSIGYFAFYELGPGPTIIAQYDEEVRVAAQQEAAKRGAAGVVTEAALKALQGDKPLMAKAQTAFVARCAACHGAQGQGLIGPNLTDEYWIHGGKLTEILNTITNGVPDKGMVPWKGTLDPAELRMMAAYVGTLQGTNPPNAKPPQGTKLSMELAPSR